MAISKVNFLCRYLKSNVPGSEGTLMHYKERPSNHLFQLFFKLHGTPIENKSFFLIVKIFKSISEVQSQTVGGDPRAAAIYKTALFP